jgi:integrase
VEIIPENKTEERYYYQFKHFQKSNLELEEYLKSLKNRKEISNLKRAFEIMKDISIDKKYDCLELIKKYHKIKPKHQKKPEEQFKLKPVQNSINRLKNKRLKLAYRLELIGGLRIEELAELEPSDIFIKGNDITIHVRHGKGNKERFVDCICVDEFVLNGLIDLDVRKNGKLFYSKSYLMNKTTNFHTHDLRKATSHIKYFNDSSEQAIENLQEFLGHKKETRTYLKYINRDVNLYGTKYDDMEPV